MPAQAFSDKSTVLMLLTGAGLTTTTGEDQSEEVPPPESQTSSMFVARTMRQMTERTVRCNR